MKKVFCTLILFISFWRMCFALKPMKEYVAFPSAYGMEFENIKVKYGNAEINTWYCHPKGKESNPTILLCGSDFGNMSYRLEIADSLYQRGFDVIMFDYQGFGESSPLSVLDTNCLVYPAFVQDFENVYSYYSKILPNRRIDVLAQSMGTIVVTLANARMEAKLSGHLILDSYIFSLSYTCNYLRNLKGRNFFSPLSDEDYSKAQQELFKRNSLCFIGNNDLISKSPDFQLDKIRQWKIVTFDGGHLGGMYYSVDQNGNPNFFSAIKDFVARN